MDVDAARLFGEIRLDEQTLLSIVAPDGTAIGNVPTALVAVAELTSVEATQAARCSRCSRSRSAGSTTRSSAMS